MRDTRLNRKLNARLARVKLITGLALMMVLGSLQGQASEPLPNAEDVLRELVRHTQAEPSSDRGYYLCTKKTVTEELDSSGRVTNRKVKVGESHIDPVAVKDANKWGSQNGVALNEDLLRRFQFTVQKREVLNGRPTFVLTFVPKDPPVPVRHFQDRLLNRAMGTLWIDEKDYELVKASLCLGQPVSFGILGAVDALSFGFERVHAEEGNWLMKWTDTFFKGRKFVIPVQFRKRVDCKDFKRLNGPGEESVPED
jgi:hypothetical protein